MGGSYKEPADECSATAQMIQRSSWNASDPQIPKSIWWFTDAFHVGFRVVRPLQEPTEAEKRRFWGDGEIKDVEEILAEGGKQARVPISKPK